MLNDSMVFKSLNTNYYFKLIKQVYCLLKKKQNNKNDSD